MQVNGIEESSLQRDYLKYQIWINKNNCFIISYSIHYIEFILINNSLGSWLNNTSMGNRNENSTRLAQAAAAVGNKTLNDDELIDIDRTLSRFNLTIFENLNLKVNFRLTKNPMLIFFAPESF